MWSGRLLVLLAIGAAACGGGGGRALLRPATTGTTGIVEVTEVAAHCVANVVGVGEVDTELQYLPRVVSCENGAADFEALKAQAIAARSYLYFKMETTGSIGDGEEDQVYSCGRDPLPQHFAAVQATSGVVLRYRNTQLAAFYVAGAHPIDTVSCVGGVDPTATERWVTYNDGRSGDDVVQSPLGWVDPANRRNRGCMSQNGSHCLSTAGRSFADILRFYYGADIVLARAVGECVVGDGLGRGSTEPERMGFFGRDAAGHRHPLGLGLLTAFATMVLCRRRFVVVGARVSLQLAGG